MGARPSTLIETIAYYEPGALERWRDSTSEAWIELIPRPYRHLESRWRLQAAIGFHFVEICQLRALHEQGLACQYEDFDLMVPPGRTAKKNAIGYAVILDAYGPDVIAELQTRARAKVEQLGYRPLTPDLFAYLRAGAIVIPGKFVEVKEEDSVKRGQLLGLALIQAVLDTRVEIVRWVPKGSKVSPMTYEMPYV
jgi:hypothetical protein